MKSPDHVDWLCPEKKGGLKQVNPDPDPGLAYVAGRPVVDDGIIGIGGGGVDSDPLAGRSAQDEEGSS